MHAAPQNAESTAGPRGSLFDGAPRSSHALGHRPVNDLRSEHVIPKRGCHAEIADDIVVMMDGMSTLDGREVTSWLGVPMVTRVMNRDIPHVCQQESRGEAAADRQR